MLPKAPEPVLYHTTLKCAPGALLGTALEALLCDESRNLFVAGPRSTERVNTMTIGRAPLD